MKELAVVIPVYNEVDNLEELYQRLGTTLHSLVPDYQLLFVDDGSTDGSAAMIAGFAAKDSCVKYLRFSRNFGHQIAVSAGIEHANAHNIVIIDADLQDPPEDIARLYSRLKEGYDVVYARRKKRKGESVMKKLTARIFYRLMWRITSVDIPIDAGDFRIMKAKVAAVLKQMPEQHKFIRGQIAWAGFKQTYIEYERDGRKSGKTGYSYARMTRFATDGITSFSDFPLKMVTWSGFFVAFIAFIVALYALYSKFVLGGAVPGWASLMISLLFLGGVQLLSLGVIGEYMSRIASNVRKRPLYVLEESNLEDSTEKDS